MELVLIHIIVIQVNLVIYQKQIIQRKIRIKRNKFLLIAYHIKQRQKKDYSI